MSTGRSSRLSYVVPASRAPEQEESVDVALMVIIAALVITSVALLTDPTILTVVARMFDSAWSAVVTVLAQR